MFVKKRLDIITEILDGSPSRMRVCYFKKNHLNILEQIESFCSNIDVSFKQMIWHWVNDSSSYYKCVCGGFTTFNRNWLDGYRENCSPKCAQGKKTTKEKRKKTTIEKYGVDNIAKLYKTKKKQAITNLERYGSTSSFQNEAVRLKYRKTCLYRYGVDHYFKTDEFKEISKISNYEKYGVSHFVQSDEYIKRSVYSNNEKYGRDWFTQTEEYLIKTRNTNNEKYGFDSYVNTSEYKSLLKKTNLEKYGSEWYFQSDEFRKSIEGIMVEKYGDGHYSKTQEYKDRVKKTNVERYGSEWYFQSDGFRDSIEDIMVEKYGSSHYSKTKEYKNLLNSDVYVERRLSQRVGHYKEMGFSFISSSETPGFVDLYSDVCGHTFSIHPTTLKRRIDVGLCGCVVCNPLNNGSGQEKRIGEWLDTLDIVYISNDKSIIQNMELDIYIPSLNLAIEYNGLYWHSDIYKHGNYHLEKTQKCNDVGIHLLHIWEDDWLYKENIVKSILMNFMGLSSNVLYARKCTISEVVDKKMVNLFFNENHIQGKTNYKTSIGLFYGDEMVSCMLFHSPRGEHELVRFCNKKFTSVVGGASRLFKYYINNFDINHISSFADISIFSGDLYTKLNFELSHRTKPNYWWVVDGIRKHRFTYNKKKLIKEGFDPLKTEVGIMHGRGYYRVYGCGLDKYIWNHK